MDTNTILAYLALLLPLLVATALIPVCWLRERWAQYATASAMECHYPIVREAVTAFLEARKPNISGPAPDTLRQAARAPTVVKMVQPPLLHESVTVPARHRPPTRKLQRLSRAAAAS